MSSTTTSSSGKGPGPSSARSTAHVLVICSNGTISSQVRQSLKNLGFGNVSAAGSHVQGYDRLRMRNFDYVIFDACDTDMKAREFVESALEMDGKMVMVAVSSQPQLDDVFGLLQAGARGYLVTPFNVDTLESVIEGAKDGPPLNENVLKAPDRNAALANALLNNLCKVAVLIRQSKNFPTAEKDAQRFRSALSESSDLARMFCEEGDFSQLREKIVDICIVRSNQAATRLGRTRKKLAKERVVGDDEQES